MDFETLANKFHKHAADIGATKDKTAKYRALSYERVANKIQNELNGETSVTKEMIDKIDISDYMKSKAADFLTGNSHKSKSAKSPSKSLKSSRTGKSKSPSKSLKSSSKSQSKPKSPITGKSKSTRTDKSSKPVDKEQLLKELSGFMGLGKEKSKVLIDAGIKNINQLHMKKYKELLPEETKLFIDLKPIREIPRADITAIESQILESANDIGRAIIVGSYRREKQTSRDIDVMLVSDDEDAIEKYLSKLQTKLPNSIYPYSKGYDKLSLIVVMPNKVITNANQSNASKPLKTRQIDEPKNDKVYKLDVFRTLPEDEIPMLLYSTGSKEHNILMRGKAKKLGYLLNQKGLYKNGKKIENLNTEQDYFNILEIEYKEPKNRV
jgi:DNA polymerase/3'-5' exonuclease PolX